MSVVKCWEIQNCKKTTCPAYNNLNSSCFYIDETECGDFKELGKFPSKLKKCRNCVVYNANIGDEMKHFTHSFRSMIRQFKVFEEELALSEDKYRNFFEKNPHPILICSCEDFVIIDSNKTASLLYEYSKQELLTLNYSSLASIEEMEGIADKCYGKNLESLLIKKRIHHKKGKKSFYADVVASPMEYISGINSVMISVTDVTTSVEQEALLIHSNRLATLGEMASGLAHEINQPLTSIRLGADILKTILPSEEKKAIDILKDIEIQILRADSVIKHVREFSRRSIDKNPDDIGVGSHILNEVSINKAIEGVIMLLGEQLRSNGIILKTFLEESIPFIKGDRMRLEQVFLNLVSNARDALKESINSSEKIISIKSFQTENDICIEIHDNGSGIPAEIIDKIFDPFFTTKEVGKGTGLGLAISSNIIRSHGGEISVNALENKGTTIKIFFKKTDNKKGKAR